MANAGSALIVEHLSVKQGEQLLVDDVTLDLRPLELHGVVGPRGAGKSLLLQAVAGLVPAGGDVMLGGVPLDREHRRQHVFYLGDDVKHAFAGERVLGVLAFAAQSLGSKKELDDVIARLDCQGLLDRRMGELARGERKRVTLAMALLVPRGFILVDEPFAGLDYKEARAITNVLRTSTNENRSLLVTLHQLGDAERLCDRFTLLSAGRVVGAGQIHELRERARTHPGAALEEVFLALC
jgi:ABC-2 type transport system ATP-binding protein